MTLTAARSNGKGDANQAMAVRNALSQYTPLRIWEQGIQVDVQGGAVILSGNVRSRAVKEMAEQIARKIKGVSAVQNQLLADTDVEIAVAQALSSDARTRAGFPGILVGVVFGVVYLKGTVSSADIKNAATEIAAKVAGVRRVSNELVVATPQKTAAPAKPSEAAAPA